MSKTAERRHQRARHMRRRLSTPLWAWAANDPTMRNRAARQAVPCSCYWCRSYRIEAAAFKLRRAAAVEGGE